MVSYTGELVKIKNLLKEHRQGMTITDISRALNIYRKTTAKYLDMLLITGQVEMRPFGPVKIYTPSRRVPLSSMLDYSRDSILLLDRELKVMEANEPMLTSLRISRAELTSRCIDDTGLPFFINEILMGHLADAVRGRSFHGSLTGPDIPGFSGRTLKIEPVTFDDGSDGASLVFISDEGMNHLEEDIKLRDGLLRVVSSLSSRHQGIGDLSSAPPPLDRIGTLLHANRVHISGNTRDGPDGLIHTRTWEWVDRATFGLADDPEFRSCPYLKAGRRMMDTLSQGRVFLGTVRDFLDEEQEFFRMQGALSIAYVPIFTGAGWWGFLGVEHCDREWEWSPGEVEGLKAIAGVLGLLLDAGGGHDVSRLMREDDGEDVQEEEDRQTGMDGRGRRNGKDGGGRQNGMDRGGRQNGTAEIGREEEGNCVNREDITP